MTRKHLFSRALTGGAVLLAPLLTLVACHGRSAPQALSSSPAGSSATPPPGAGGATVEVKGFAFGPEQLTVKTGEKVTWKFEDTTLHNVLSGDKKIKSEDLKSGQSFSFVFNSPGTYNYVCSIHEYMHGSIVVK